MNQRKVYSQGSVPFSWENKPGVTKARSPSDAKDTLIKLPPPPYHPDSKVVGQETLQVPLPPCLFQPPLRSSSRKGGHRRKEDDDPFLAAYKEVTKSVKHGKLSKSPSRIGGLFSCKHSCRVIENSLVVKMASANVPRERHDFHAE